MANILLAGEMGSGKTTLSKEYISRTKRHNNVFALLKQDFPANVPVYTNFEKYISDAVKKSNEIFVCDEAYTVLPKNEPNPKNAHEHRLLVFLVNSRKLNNLTLWNFHALNQIPLWLLNYSSLLVRFKTKDLLQYQITRFGSFPTVVKSLTDFPEIPQYEYDEIKLR